MSKPDILDSYQRNNGGHKMLPKVGLHKTGILHNCLSYKRKLPSLFRTADTVTLTTRLKYRKSFLFGEVMKKKGFGTALDNICQ